MANVTLNDLFTAIDEYMSENGVSSSGNYLASKISALFDDEDAPLNATTGPLKKLSDKVESFVDNITVINHEMDIMASNLKVGNKKLDKFFRAVSDTIIKFNSLQKIIEGLTKKFQSSVKLRAIRAGASVPMGGKTIAYMAKTEYGKLLTDSVLVALKAQSKVAKTFDPKKLTTVNLPKIIEDGVENGFIKALTKHPVLSPHPAPLALSPTSILSVKIVDIDKKIKLGNTIYNRNIKNTGGKEEAGFMSKIFSFLFSAAIGVTGIFFLQKFLDNTDIGKKIKGYIKNYVKIAGDWLGKKLDTGAIAKAFRDVIGFVGRAFMFVFGGIMDFMQAHKDKIMELGGVILTGIKDKIIVPVFNKLKGVVVENGWKGLGSTILTIGSAYLVARMLPIVKIPIRIFEWAFGKTARLISWSFKAMFGRSPTSALGKLISGVFGWIGNAGKWLFGAFRGAITGTLRLLGGLGATIGRALLPILEGAVGVIGSGLRLLFANPLGLAVVAAVASLTNLGIKLKGFYDGLEYLGKQTVEIGQAQARMVAFLDKKVSERDKKAQDAKEAYKNDPSEVNRIKMLQSEFSDKSAKLLHDQEVEQKKLTDVYNSYGIGMRYFFNNEYLRQQSMLSKRFDDEREALKKQIFGNDQKAAGKIVKVNDAIIVEPHTKDQVVMAKKDGVFSNMIDDMTSKLDMLMEVIAGGFASSVNATQQGSSVVANAVTATANAKQSSGGVSSGVDTIRNMRAKAKSFIG